MPIKLALTLSAFVVVVVASVTLRADDQQRVEFRSAAANAAKSQFASRLAEIEKEAESKAAAARTAFVAELEKAKQDATRRADLDEALRIRDELVTIGTADPGRALAPPGWRAREAFASRIVGTTWTIAGDWRLTLKADGSTAPRPGNVQGRWSVVGNLSVILIFEDGWADHWRFDERLTVAKVVHARLGDPLECKRAP